MARFGTALFYVCTFSSPVSGVCLCTIDDVAFTTVTVFSRDLRTVKAAYNSNEKANRSTLA